MIQLGMGSAGISYLIYMQDSASLGTCIWGPIYQGYMQDSGVYTGAFPF